jgi:HlyD family secretion protein
MEIMSYFRPAAAAAAVLLLATTVACGRDASAKRRSFETAEVQRRDISVTASASGVIEPTRIIEVKSKASGEIVELPVETGTFVERGAVLARIYPRDAQQQFAQARAEVEAAKARLATGEAELARATRLFQAELLPETDFEMKRLEVINARAQLVKAQTSMEIAAERLRETTVTAPVAGRIIQKGVELGNVVSSAISQVSGGTTLLKMADLRQVQVRALVDETDIGKLQPGQAAEVKVEAFPGRTFRGRIEKIEPQSVVEQNVTMFPVLVSLQNDDEALKPGMNAEVEVAIARHPNVVSVPNEAVKTPRDAVTAGAALGVPAEDVRALSGPPGGGGRPAGGASAKGGGSPAGGGRPPEAGRGAEGSRKREGGERASGGSGGGRGQRGGGNSAIVFKVEGEKITPVRVTLGASNWDYTQIVSGLNEGDEVAVLPSASLMRQQQEFRDRMRGASGMPGMGGGARRQ